MASSRLMNSTLVTLSRANSLLSRLRASCSDRLSSTKASTWFSCSSFSSVASAFTAIREKVPMMSKQATVMPMAAKDMKPWVNMLESPSVKK